MFPEMKRMTGFQDDSLIAQVVGGEFVLPGTAELEPIRKVVPVLGATAADIAAHRSAVKPVTTRIVLPSDLFPGNGGLYL